jgi:3-oxoacyl-[acyl-carrier-protein] synthase-3
MVTQTPDYFQPATSCVIHGKLGLSKDCAALDINLGCSGYVYGLWFAAMMVSSGSCKRVLLLAGDTLSRCVSPHDSAVAPLFGDAGSAAIIENGSDDYSITFALHSDGSGYHHLIMRGGAFRDKSSNLNEKIEKEQDSLRDETHLHMNGAEIFNFSITEIPALIEEVLALSNWTKEEIDYFILHQANKFIVQNIARKIRVNKDKAPYNVFEKYGNQSSASIPVSICENLHEDIGSQSMKIVLVGFGTGLSWAACVLSIGPMNCHSVITFG